MAGAAAHHLERRPYPQRAPVCRYHPVLHVAVAGGQRGISTSNRIGAIVRVQQLQPEIRD
jgi:hypothetical protein